MFQTRRSFLALVSAAVAAPFAPLRAAAAPSVPLADLCIAGGGYHGLDAALPQLVVGSRLTLRREPGNPHDANAIEVVDAEGLKLGYVPRALAARLAPVLDDGEDCALEVIRFLGDETRPERMGGLWSTTRDVGDPVLRLVGRRPLEGLRAPERGRA